MHGDNAASTASMHGDNRLPGSIAGFLRFNRLVRLRHRFSLVDAMKKQKEEDQEGASEACGTSVHPKAKMAKLLLPPLVPRSPMLFFM